ncbi:MAG: hypothetical protein KAY24_01135 [Candidatus Eisenbacteria sp.]|nr:hypothetical protein [Candidatus Eisenbacteria bacterium]
MDITITVTVKDEDVEEMARLGASLMGTQDSAGRPIDVSLEDWLTAHASREVVRLAGVAFGATEDKLARFKAIAEQVRAERIAKEKE